jgi:hypothetical protein
VAGGDGGALTGDSVLQTVVVRVKPGKLDEYLARVAKLQAAGDRTGSSSQMRIWQATQAGPLTGNIVVGLVHPSLAAFAENTTKTQADPEWQKTIAGLDDIRTIVSSSLAQSLGL